MVSALKTLAQIDVAEKRKAQDGRFRVRTDESDVDFRVATANSIFGEKLVIRILNRRAGLLGLADLGMPEAMLEHFAQYEPQVIRETPLGPNTLVVFEGALVHHQVTPILEGERRIILSMTYCTDPRAHWWQAASRRIKDTAFFGIRALWT